MRGRATARKARRYRLNSGHGATLREQFARARAVGPRFAMVVSWNEWTTGEQPSIEVSKDLEPSLTLGDRYLKLLKEEIRRFKTE